MSSARPPTPDDLLELATGLYARSMYAQAEPVLRHLAEITPRNGEVQNLLGLTLAAGDDLEQAVRHAQAAASAEPGTAKYQANLAMVLGDLERFDEAERCYRLALERDPDHWPARSGLGQLLLLQGRPAEGYEHYRRLKKPYQLEGARVCFWNGEPLAGKSLLVLRAQGLGEEIHAARYYRQLVQTCSSVTVVCDRRLLRLLAGAADGLSLVPGDDIAAIAHAAPRADYVCYITDLVALLEPTGPNGGGYLAADPGLVDELHEKYRRQFGDRRLVGISWRTSSRLRPAARSIRPEFWASVLRTDNCQFISLQYGARHEAVKRISESLDCRLAIDPDVDCRDDISALSAQICAMDQIISIDNSTVHLAGALDRPVWTLLTDVPYWMWGLRGGTSAWYPSMRLFRQKRRGRWRPVLRQVARELKAAPASSAVSRPKPAEAYLAAIHQKFEARDYPASLALLGELGRAHPGHEKTARWTALCLYRQDRLEDAVSWAERAMAQAPGTAENHRVLGIIQQGLLEFDEAEKTFRTGMRLAPQRADLRSALIMQLLLQERCEEGWRLYDGVNRAFVETRLRSGRQWRGERLRDEALHLWALEGIGDYSLALRMLPEIETRAPNLILECDERLIPLLRRCGTSAELHALRPREVDTRLDALGKVQTPEFAAIRHLAPNLRLDGIATANLVPDPNRVRDLKAKYAALFPGKRMIGLSWYSASVSMGVARSIPPDALVPLLNQPDCQFVDLQYNNPDCPMTAYHLEPGSLYRDDTVDSWSDLDGLAAQLAALDLTITIDNSTAQIAGAVGAPCWTLLHTLPDWRWGLSGETCVWYPEMRLFRQQARCDWSAPLDAVCKSLGAVAWPRAEAV